MSYDEYSFAMMGCSAYPLPCLTRPSFSALTFADSLVQSTPTSTLTLRQDRKSRAEYYLKSELSFPFHVDLIASFVIEINYIKRNFTVDR